MVKMFAETTNQPGQISFHVGRTPVIIQPFFWLITLLLASSYFQEKPQPWPIVTWVLACFGSILLHELGHVWMGSFFGAAGCRILLSGMGGLAVGATRCQFMWQRVLVYLAGPGIQLLLACILFFLFPEEGTGWIISDIFIRQMMLINIVWPVFNLLPIFPLDGGQITREILHGYLPRLGEVISAWSSLIIAVGVGILVFQATKSIYNALLFGIFAVTNLQRIQNTSHEKGYGDSSWRH